MRSALCAFEVATFGRFEVRGVVPRASLLTAHSSLLIARASRLEPRASKVVIRRRMTRRLSHAETQAFWRGIRLGCHCEGRIALKQSLGTS